MAIHRRPPTNTIIGAFADSACKTCNARIPVVTIEHSTNNKPASAKRRQRVTEFAIVFMLNQTEQLQKCHADFKQPNDLGSATVERSGWVFLHSDFFRATASMCGLCAGSCSIRRAT